MKLNLSFLLVAALAAAPMIGCKVSPKKASGRGQTCSASNDCQDQLLCVNSVCIQNDYPVDTTAKVCDIIECDADADCCANFDPPAACEDYQAQCDPADPLTEVYCDLYEEECVCSEVCNENQRCEEPEDPCTDDTECGGFADMCDTSTGECVECLGADDCDENEMCIEGSCDNGCTKNEDCELFNSCNTETGLCEESGCTSDRECILFTGKADSVCKTVEGADPICSIPCEENAECGSLNVCEDGECKFLGCETNEECRTYLGVDDDDRFGEDAKAICRDQENDSDDGFTGSGFTGGFPVP